MARAAGAAAREARGDKAARAPSAPNPANASRRVKGSPRILRLPRIISPILREYSGAYHLPQRGEVEIARQSEQFRVGDASALGLSQRRLATFQALSGPQLLGAVIRLESGNALRQGNPRLLGARVDMHIGLQRRGLIQR